jgi:hypothetical protein
VDGERSPHPEQASITGLLRLAICVRRQLYLEMAKDVRDSAEPRIQLVRGFAPQRQSRD